MELWQCKSRQRMKWLSVLPKTCFAITPDKISMLVNLHPAVTACVLKCHKQVVLRVFKKSPHQFGCFCTLSRFQQWEFSFMKHLTAVIVRFEKSVWARLPVSMNHYNSHGWIFTQHIITAYSLLGLDNRHCGRDQPLCRHQAILTLCSLQETI